MLYTGLFLSVVPEICTNDCITYTHTPDPFCKSPPSSCGCYNNGKPVNITNENDCLRATYSWCCVDSKTGIVSCTESNKSLDSHM